MNVDELASAFEAIVGEGSRIDHTEYIGEHVGLLDEPETVRLVPPLDPDAARDLRDLIDVAVVVFGLDGPETAEERWCRFVLEHATKLAKSEPAGLVRLVGDDGTRAIFTVLTDRIHDAAMASARVVRKCRHPARAEPAATATAEARAGVEEDPGPTDSVTPKLKPSVRRAGASFEWVCRERPELVETAASGRRTPTDRQYEHIKCHGCEAYPGGKGGGPGSRETWKRYVRDYLKATEGPVNTSRSGRTGRSIVTPDQL